MSPTRWHMRDFPKRKPNRLIGYDYNSNGAYFLTLCVKDRYEMLGTIKSNTMYLSEYGQIVERELVNTNSIRSECMINQYVIMPNHIHLILLISQPVGDDGNRPVNTVNATSTAVPSFIRGFKGAVTRHIGFSMWQRSFHDHIIRSESDYLRIAEYIEQNPANWENDCFYTIV